MSSRGSRAPRASWASSDERPHPAGDGQWWAESWDFDFASVDGAVGGYVRLSLFPNRGACSYWACTVGAGRDLVLVVDHDVTPPRTPSLEIRTEGLWADHIVEDPFDHVSVGCEAFALRLDDPASALESPLLGERTPFGLDLGWETDGPITTLAAGSPVTPSAGPPRPSDGGAAVAGASETPPAGGATLTTGYAVACRVVGTVLVGSERIELDGFGWRRHAWGAEPWPPSASRSVRGRFADGAWLYDESGGGGTGAPAGTDRGRYRVDPIAGAPLLVPTRDGAAVRLSPTLCRLSDPADDGRAGVGWTDHVVLDTRTS